MKNNPVLLNVKRRNPLAGQSMACSDSPGAGPKQLWIADITYVRLKAEFVYLAVVLDAFSRKVVG